LLGLVCIPLLSGPPAGALGSFLLRRPQGFVSGVGFFEFLLFFFLGGVFVVGFVVGGYLVLGLLQRTFSSTFPPNSFCVPYPFSFSPTPCAQTQRLVGFPPHLIPRAMPHFFFVCPSTCRWIIGGSGLCCDYPGEFTPQISCRLFAQ